MKFDPIKPAPPVTRIVFSIAVELASNAIAPTARPIVARERSSNCKQKERDSPRPLVGTFGFVQTKVPHGLRRLSYPHLSLRCRRRSCYAPNRPLGRSLRQLPAHHFEIHPCDRRGNLRPLTMFADARFAACRAAPTAGFAIRNRGRFAKSATSPRRKLNPRSSTASAIFRYVAAEHAKPAPIASSRNLKTFASACINLGTDLRA